MAKRRIGIFGSTGSIGTQTIEVVLAHPELFCVTILVANQNVELLIQQAKLLKPKMVVIGNVNKYEELKSALGLLEIEVLAGHSGIIEAARSDVYDFMVAAITGFQGLFSVIEAIKCNKIIGLANKESIVVGGNIITRLVQEYGVTLLPIDSEHSAIFQCLLGETKGVVKKIILTASGGPFRGRKPNFLINVRKEHALQHPTWKMGSKISIDSSTLMNKGLEMIEAKWLFDLESSQIDVLVHPESIIHSIVSFVDGSYKAQFSIPSMKFPIQFAMSYPNRLAIPFKEVDFIHLGSFTLEAPDVKTFRCLDLARIALEKGGNFPCGLNSANEIAVEAFLENKIKFLEIPLVIENILDKIIFIKNPTLDDYVRMDYEVRLKTYEEIDKIKDSKMFF